jgi:hypothetical protein
MISFLGVPQTIGFLGFPESFSRHCEPIMNLCERKK